MRTIVKTINYTAHQSRQVRVFKVYQKVKGANTRFAADKISTHDVLMVLEKFKFTCIYCNEPLKATTWQLDHFHAKASGGKNVFENLAPACKWCNQMKGALDGFGFLARCKFIAKNNFIKKTVGEIYYTESTSKQRNTKKRYADKLLINN